MSHYKTDSSHKTNLINELLKKFQRIACNEERQYEAGLIRIKLKKLLSSKEYDKLVTAHSRFRVGGGSEQLKSIIKELIHDYPESYNKYYKTRAQYSYKHKNKVL